MFRDTLLESSSTGRKRKRWPLTLAFALEALIGVALISLPLLSTGVLPVSAHIVCPIAPLGHRSATRPPTGDPRTGGPALHPVALNPTVPCFSCKHTDVSSRSDDVDSLPPTIGTDGGLPDGLTVPDDHVVPEQPKPPKRIPVSEISEGQLIHKVEPVYPRMALITGVKGEVRLHAVIATDGTIQSLAVVSGPPLLIAAARDAVSQWRYRPYRLNGQPVEVETFITVSFKGIRD
jgi:protein TonB